MSDYFSRAVQGLGQSLQGYGGTIIQVDTERKYKDGALAIAQEVDAFRKGLYSDPDHGLPGSSLEGETGYMGKWEEFAKGIQERIDSASNPLAKKQLQDYWDQTRLQQQSQIYDIQYKAWAEDTVSAADKRILEMLQTGGAVGQDAFDYAQDELNALRDQNLLTDDMVASRMAEHSKLIIRKEMADEARRIHNEEGLPAALRYIADNQEAFTAGGRTFMASDDIKALVQSDVVAYHKLAQDEIHAVFEEQFGNYLVQNPPAGAKFLTHDTIDASKADPDLKLMWHDRLSGYMRTTKGDDSGASRARYTLSLLQYGAFARERGASTGTAAYIKFTDPDTGADRTYGANIEGLTQLLEDEYSYLAASGLMSQALTALKEMEEGDYGAWSVALDEVGAIKDPEAKMRAMYYINNVKAQFPDATKEQVAEYLQIAQSKKTYRPLVMGRFELPKLVGEGDEDTITMDNWDGALRWHVGGDPAGGMMKPIAWQSKEALQSYEAATYREAEAALKAAGLETTSLTGAWLPRGGIDQEGNADYVITATLHGGRQVSLKPVPAVNDKGRREAALLWQERRSGSDELITKIQDPANPEAFYEVDAIKARRADGWALPKAVAEERERVATEKERSTQRKEYAKRSWPTAVSAYPVPKGFSRMEWNRQFSGLKDRQNWYYDNGYTWNGKEFVKAEE